MASLQSTLNVQAFRFPFRFHDMKSNSNNRESGDSEGESASMKLFHFFPPGSCSQDNSSFLPSIPCGQLQHHPYWQSYA